AFDLVLSPSLESARENLHWSAPIRLASMAVVDRGVLQVNRCVGLAARIVGFQGAISLSHPLIRPVHEALRVGTQRVFFLPAFNAMEGQPGPQRPFESE